MWGLKPKVVYWIYTTPMLTYGSTVWWSLVTYKVCKMELSRLQRLTCLPVTGVTRMAQTAAMEVLLAIPPLQVTSVAEAHTRLYRLMGSQQKRSKSTNFCHARKSWDIECEPILQMRTDEMIPIYAHQNPFSVKFPAKCEWQNGFNPDIKAGMVWYIDGFKTNKGTRAKIV